MKEGWEYRELGEILEVKHGKDQKDVADPNGKYPIYGSGGNIIGYANQYLCEEGTTILGRKGTIDKPMFMDCKFWNIDTAFGLVPKEGNNSKLIFYICKTIDWKGLDSGAAKPSLTQNIIKNQVALVPPLSEQQRIVTYLDSSFSKIDELKENVAKELSDAKALFQAELKKCMEKKEGWEEKKLVDTCEEITDFVAAGSFASLRENVVYQESPNYAQLVRTMDLKSNFTKGTPVYVTKEAFDFLYRVNLNEECIILPNVGVNCGEVYFVSPSMLPFPNNVLGPNAILVRSQKVNNKFLSYAFQGEDFQKKLKGIQSHMAQPKFNKTALRAQTIHLPSSKEQHQIVTHLDTLSQKIQELEKNYNTILAECDALKQAILRETFE